MIDFYQFPSLQSYDNVVHAVTQKQEQFPHAFSLALHTGEVEEHIVQNREELAKALEQRRDWHFVVANQTHSDHIVVVDEALQKGWHSLEDAITDCDALMTHVKGCMLGILTADCVPILLYDKEKEVVAAVHAGWKGSQANIVGKSVQKMQEVYGSSPEEIVAVIAPSIGKCCYEVGEEVAKHFYEMPQSFSKEGEKYRLDLPYINKYQLLEAGLKEEHITLSHLCTACDTQHFFSYRKEQGCSGRFMSLIGLT